MSKLLTKKQIETLFDIFEAKSDNPETELLYKNSFQLLIAVVLSAQTTDKGVNRATQPLFEFIQTPRDMAEFGEERLIEAIKTIGLYRNKAKNVIALSQKLINEFDGHVPSSRESLESLPGVGRKTANVVLNVIFNEPTMAVDTHIFRLSNRLGLVNAKNVRSCEDQLLAGIPKHYLIKAHHWLILHGRYVCKARRPECWRCVVQHLCAYEHKNKDP